MDKIISLKIVETQNKVNKALNDVGITLEMLTCNKVQVAWKNKGDLGIEVSPFRVDARSGQIKIIFICCEDDFSIKEILLKPEKSTVQIFLYSRDGERIQVDENSVSIKFI